MKEDETIRQDALEFVKNNKNELIQRYSSGCIEIKKPVTLFMAGSPGAGKTEVSKSLAKKFSTKIMRIDADEIRAWCPGYNGDNAHLFQNAATKGVHMLFDYALSKKKCHVILDGTFAYFDALKNMQRSLGKGRLVELWFVYQDPQKAWEFTIAREAEEARHVNKETFIDAFIKSRNNAKEAKNKFKDKLTLNLLIKNTDNTNGELYLNIRADELDYKIKNTYTKEDLRKILI